MWLWILCNIANNVKRINKEVKGKQSRKSDMYWQRQIYRQPCKNMVFMCTSLHTTFNDTWKFDLLNQCTRLASSSMALIFS
eukprot:m.49472 g.49472  ORF g.49472 m.49472 type:complete len:81 (-) comp10616_c0_seq2:2690-2932(-)